jgi:hypothetical protein
MTAPSRAGSPALDARLAALFFGAAGSPSVALDAAVGYLVLAAVVAEGNVR